MRPETIQILLDLNRQFYQIFGPAFAATRRRIQPGVRRVIASLPEGASLLDLGCGSGALAAELAQTWRQGSYLGLDFSAELLSEARQMAAAVEQPGVLVQFAQADLTNPGWAEQVRGQTFDIILSFAALHHIPGAEVRTEILQLVRQHLPVGGKFIHSEWQFQHSPKLMERRQPWSKIGLDERELDPGDTLLDWRHALPGQAEQVGLRYVHLFSADELADLAAQTGFQIVETFESDGDGGRLGLYQVWEKLG